MLGRISLCAVLTAVLLAFSSQGVHGILLWGAVYLLIGYDVLYKAVTGIFRGRFLDECFLMAIATVGAFALAAWGRGDCLEAVAVMLFYQTGEFLSELAVQKSRKSIGELMKLRPEYANLFSDGEFKRVLPEDVAEGSIISVAPGEKIPLDGVVVSGDANVDTSALTGESVPRFVSEGTEVLGGFVCLDGRLEIRVVKTLSESTIAKILALVEEASMKKARSERFISRFARVYTPIICISAACVAVIPPLALTAFGQAPMWGEWIYRALSFLVVSCPCALVVSVPLAFFSAIGNASKNGVLIKGSTFVERLSRMDIIAFDKTGTLTEGSFVVSNIMLDPFCSKTEEEVLEFAAYGEISSSHPIAAGIKAAYGKEVDINRVSGINERAGKGVILFFDGRKIAVGNEKLMLEEGIEDCIKTEEGTAVHVAADGEYLGCLSLCDMAKPSSKKAISVLKKQGVRKALVLTGDRMEAARKIAEEVGADEVCASLLPNEKEEVFIKKVERFRAEKKKGCSAYAGDGINDAPLLAFADVGIAMGGIGSDAAIEAADIVIMNDDPMGIAYAHKKAKACMRTVKINIVLSLAVKAVCLALVGVGAAGMWLAIFADVGVMILAVLNSILLLMGKKHEKE